MVLYNHCRASCAWEGWSVQSSMCLGGGIVDVCFWRGCCFCPINVLQNRCAYFLETPTALNKNITRVYGATQLYILYSSPVIQTIPTHLYIGEGGSPDLHIRSGSGPGTGVAATTRNCFSASHHLKQFTQYHLQDTLPMAYLPPSRVVQFQQRQHQWVTFLNQKPASKGGLSASLMLSKLYSVALEQLAACLKIKALPLRGPMAHWLHIPRRTPRSATLPHVIEDYLLLLNVVMCISLSIYIYMYVYIYIYRERERDNIYTYIAHMEGLQKMCPLP